MKPFRLQDLPEVIFHDIVFLNTTLEAIKLAVCSSKMERRIRRLDVHAEEYKVHIQDESNIFIEEINCGQTFQKWFVKNGRTIANEHLSGAQIFSMVETEWQREVRLFRKKSNVFFDYEPYFELKEGANLINTAEWLMRTVTAVKFGWDLNLYFIKEKGLEFILNHPLFQSSNTMSIGGATINAALMRRVIDQCSSFRVLNILSPFPQGFRHENPFCESLSFFTYAVWITIDHLLSIRDLRAVFLCGTTLNHKEVKTVIKSWMENDFDMFYHLALVFLAGDYQVEEDIFGEFVTLETEQDPPCYFLTPKQCQNKTLPLLEVKLTSSKVTLRPQEADDYKRELRILGELQKKADWEEELRTISEKEELGVHSLGTLKSLRARKRDIEINLQKLESELKADDVEFQSGRAVIKAVPKEE